ncbi:MAG: TrmB family transcriptional regulator [Spirochaetaceae bacterium]|nr:TrmB family transcriptional regulator [Spirochaetaceae bacterium]
MNPDQDEVLADLKELGFTEYEAKVYLALLHSHPSSAYTISQGSGVPHSRVYDITRRLIKKGYAVSQGSNPEVFAPLSPDDLMDKLRRDTERLTDRVGTRLKSMDFRADFDPVWNLKSRDEALDRCSMLIDDARRHIFIGLWEEEFGLLEDALRRAESRGVRVLILLYGDRDIDFGTLYHHATEYMPAVAELGRSIDAAFDADAALSGTLGNILPCQAIWTKNRGLVNSIEGYIIHDFYLAEIRLAIGDKMDKLFGANLSALREKFYSR